MGSLKKLYLLNKRVSLLHRDGLGFLLILHGSLNPNSPNYLCNVERLSKNLQLYSKRVGPVISNARFLTSFSAPEAEEKGSRFLSLKNSNTQNTGTHFLCPHHIMQEIVSSADVSQALGFFLWASKQVDFSKTP
ncbi:hypothetical protein AMTR_s00077p00118450 [Amborella trichopoda]|uniref:Uncharacterized protein n=1 Tax=Amborella trichopoda TaxID=13333 RepID=W1PB22_AMBTC|nr:hypothetical protein AMTR_s00077p00118450 [Amborella trichopoda]